MSTETGQKNARLVVNDPPGQGLAIEKEFNEHGDFDSVQSVARNDLCCLSTSNGEISIEHQSYFL